MQTVHESSSNEARLQQFFSKLLKYAEHWREERRLMQEHAALVDELEATGDLDALLEAVGATRGELRAFEISPLRADHLLDRMMLHVGVERARLSNVTLDDLRKACHCCASWKRCRRWLADCGEANAYREFCPNAGVLDRLTRTT